MAYYPKVVRELLARLEKLPGIGPKSAERIVNCLLEMKTEEVAGLADSLKNLKTEVGLCKICFNLSEGPVCFVCRDESRKKTICVVEEVKDLVVMEKAGYQGLYHVLGGRISALDNIEPEHLRISQLLERLQAGGIEEVIIATNPTPEGEDTAVYLSGLLKKAGIKHSRLAYGLPVGAELEYMDGETLKRSLQGRNPL